MFKNVVLKMANVNTQEEIDLCPFQKKKTKFALTKLQEITLKSAVDFLYKNFYVFSVLQLDEEETHDITGTEGKSTGFLYK